ncbi:hypothetical protein F5Y09DRAFT_323966 [Xylaria sp. FL1042]|nr:hypothetical protein F5Y09DRAFT_323966 [Xylaria sp. FL1042]
MARFNLDYLRIDRECIVPEDGNEKEIAVQAMDLLYNRSNHPLGLSSEPTLSVAKLELLEGSHSPQQVVGPGMDLLRELPWWYKHETPHTALRIIPRRLPLSRNTRYLGTYCSDP